MVSAPPKPQPLTCPKPMGEYLSRRACGKKVKGQTDAGEWWCGPHLGAYKRVQKNDAERDRVSDMLRAIRERYELEGRVFGSRTGTYTGEIVVNVHHLLELLTELSTNQPEVTPNDYETGNGPGDPGHGRKAD